MRSLQVSSPVQCLAVSTSLALADLGCRLVHIGSQRRRALTGTDSSRCVSRQVELDKGARQNGLTETEGGHDTDMGAHGATNQASPMRHRLRSSGAMEGQVRGLGSRPGFARRLGVEVGAAQSRRSWLAMRGLPGVSEVDFALHGIRTAGSGPTQHVSVVRWLPLLLVTAARQHCRTHLYNRTACQTGHAVETNSVVPELVPPL